MTRARKPVTLEQRAEKLTAPDDIVLRKAILRELRAAVRAEREACARECETAGALRIASADVRTTIAARIRRRGKA